MNTHIHCHNHQLHCGEIMMDVCGHVGFFFFPLPPVFLSTWGSSNWDQSSSFIISCAIFFPSLFWCKQNFLWSYFSWKNLTLWGCQTWLRNSDTALFILSFAGNYRRIVNLTSGFLQSFNPPLTTFDHRPKNLIPAQLKLLVHPVCKRTSNTNHHTNWFIVSVRCPAFNLKMLKMSSSASCRCCLVYNSSKDITQSSHLLSIYIHI